MQGRLVGPWVDELRSAWEKAHQEGDARRRIVELINLSFIDRNGEGILAEILAEGAEFIASGIYTTYVLSKICNGLKRNPSTKVIRTFKVDVT